MDDDQVYFRSPSGDEAVLQPMRLLQQNLRRALSLVDGKHSVAEIATRFGDPGIARAALADLARAGLIETSEGRAVRQAQLTPARTGALGESAPRVRQAEVIMPGPSSPPPARPVPAAPPAMPIIEEISLSDDSELEDEDLDFEATLPWGYKQPGTAGPNSLGPQTLGPQTLGPRSIAGQSRSRPTEEERRQVEEKRRLPLHLAVGWPLLLLISLITLGALTIAVAQFFPYDRYRPEVEYSLSSFVGQPVRFARMHMTFLPQPNLTLDQVTVGAKSEVTIGTVKIVPTTGSIFAKTWEVKQLMADGVEIGLGGVMLLGRPHENPDHKTKVKFDSVEITNLAVNLGEVRVERLNGKAEFDSSGMKSAKLESEDRGARLALQAAGGGFRIEMHALDWKASSLISVQSLDLEAALDAAGLTIPKVDSKILGGLIKGQASLAWNGSIAQIVADVDAIRLDATQLATAFAPNWLLRGEWNGRFHFSSTSSNPKVLVESMKVEGNFDVQRGNVERMDLVQAVKNAGVSTRSGSTRFDAISGTLLAENQTLAVTGLQMISGVIRAAGSLRVERNGDLTGTLQVNLPQIQASVALMGTLREPVLRASR